MRVSNFPIPNFVAGDMSASITSAPVSVYEIFGWSAQFVFTGAPVGTLKVQVSNDPVSSGPTVWTDLGSASLAISAAGNSVFNFSDAFYNWIQFVYTKTSGTGSISARINLKGV